MTRQFAVTARGWRSPGRWALAAAFLWIAAPGEAAAETAAATLPATLDAVGRINHAGYRKRKHCSFTAVTPGVAVSAEHCVAGLRVDEFHLLYGYSRMTWTAHGRLRDVRMRGHDLVVLCLAEDAPATIEIGPPVAVGDTVRVVGYGWPKVHVQHETVCKVAQRTARQIGLDCPLARGVSGGPLLDSAGRIVGVASATGESVSVAAAVPQDAPAACEEDEEAGVSER